MNRESPVEKIKASAKNGNIICKQPLKIAEEENVTPEIVGEQLNEMKIRIVGCQLGCFP